MSESYTYEQVRLVSREPDGSTKVHQGTRSVSPRERKSVLDKWVAIMDQYPDMHLAIESRTVTQSHTEWETAVDHPKSTLF